MNYTAVTIYGTVNIPNIMHWQYRYEGATNRFKLDAQQQFIQVGDRLGAAQCLKSLGNIMHMQNRYEDAAQRLLEAQQQFIQIGNKIGVAQCLQSLGNIIHMQDRYEDATKGVPAMKNTT
jgi:hypothetical protein